MRALVVPSVVTLLLVLLVTPTASAAAGAGTFTLEDSLTLPGGSEIVVTPLAMLVDDTTGLQHFHVNAPVATVHVYEYRYFEVNTAAVNLDTPADPTQVEEIQYSLTNARIQLLPAGIQSGYMGAYPHPDATLHLAPDAPVNMESRLLSALTTVDASARFGESPDWSVYEEHVRGPHLRMGALGSAVLHGPAAVKLFGPDVQVASSGEVVTYETGDWRESDHERMRRWVYVEFEEGFMEFTTGEGPMDVAAEEATEFSWNGMAAFTPREGSLETRSVHYHPPGGPVSLTGEFTGNLVPLEEDRDAIAVMTLDGHVKETTLTAEPVPLMNRVSGSGFAPIILLVGTTLVVAGAASRRRGALSRHVRPRAPPRRVPEEARQVGPRQPVVTGSARQLASLSECVAQARAAARARRWDTALAWTRAAQRLAATDPHFHLLEGDYLKRLGRPEGARTAYETAARLGDKGHAEYRLTVLSAETEDTDAAVRYLTRALHRNPRLVESVIADPALVSVLEHPAAMRACEGARLRLRHGLRT